MKKVLNLSLVIAIIFIIGGCGNRNSFISLVFSQEQIQPQSLQNNSNLNETQIQNNNTTTVNNTTNETSIIEEYDIVEEKDYYDVDYTKENSEFIITAIKNTIEKDGKIINPISQARGYISGINGTYFIEIPYTNKLQIGDKVDITYLKGYDYINDEIIITDIAINNGNNTVETFKENDEEIEMSNSDDIIEEVDDNKATNSEVKEDNTDTTTKEETKQDETTTKQETTQEENKETTIETTTAKKD